PLGRSQPRARPPPAPRALAAPEAPVPEPSARGEMPFLDHLEELRWRILYSLLAVVLCTLVGWWVVQHFDVIGLLKRPIAPLIPADAYFGIAAQLIIAFGLITELPLVVTILAALGVVTPRFLAKNRRYAIVLSAVAAALLSPPDAVSMIVMLVPLLLLYEV